MLRYRQADPAEFKVFCKSALYGKVRDSKIFRARGKKYRKLLKQPPRSGVPLTGCCENATLPRMTARQKPEIPKFPIAIGN